MQRPGTTDDVRRYYDANTRSFQRFSQSGHEGTIRRAVWGPSVADRRQAFRYVDRLIADELHSQQRQPGGADRAVSVLDLGCGLGSSLLALAQLAPIQGVGITLSSVQAGMAAERFVAAGKGDSLRCIQGDYLTLTPDFAPVQLAFAIESFIHCTSARAFFAAAARYVRPGGTLIVCDDLTRVPLAELRPEQTRCMDEFVRGWMAHNVVTFDESNASAAAEGFELKSTHDLTQYLELGRPRDRLVAIVVKLGRHLPVPGYRFRSLLGGNALQEGLRSGLLEYRYTVWRRGESAHSPAAV